MLEALHDKDEYDRIVIVGHSLGSVIGYDITTHAWVKYHEVHLSKAHGETMVALESLEERCRNIDQPEAPLPPVKSFQAAQRNTSTTFGAGAASGW